MSVSVHTVLHVLPVQLRDRAAALDDHTLPPELQTLLDRCRDDLAVILAATEDDTLTLLDGVASFEALRDFLLNQ